ncbi:MAG: phosphoribosylglycinamide formyltransferase [Planctomycetes bacterium]|nr:phosphoribosylglycinamide formyltransferase [Planctomycetota bacterium]
MSRARLVVLASGGGRTLENLQEQILAGRLDAEIVLVVLSKSGLGAEQRATRLGLPVVIIGKESHPDRSERDQALLAALDAAAPDLVLMAGWLQLLPIPERYEGKVLNIHPSLLPAYGGRGFYGHHVHEAVARDRQPISGCTVHFATEAYDEGPIVLQEAVLLPADAEPDAIAALVFAAECRAYPDAVRAILAGEARWVAGQVCWSETAADGLSRSR